MTDLLTGPELRVGHTAPSPLSAAGLRLNGKRAACLAGERVITHVDLADLVDERRLVLGTRPRLVVLHGSNSLDFVVTYLAALEGCHPVIVAGDARSATSLGARFGAAISVDASAGGAVRIEHLEASTVPAWHPDLAALMSTSGSTGSPKLVRLSHDAVTSNAIAIAESLDLDADDRAITSLPLHYCYGLSVVTSHLAVGGSIVLTDTSVVDPCFWSAIAGRGVTTLAGVPHTFDMIDRLAADVLAAPSLRRVTQAGGRMKPEVVERFAGHGVQHGWDLVVMYGQTEATARMACLPAAEVFTASNTVGAAIPGGALRLEPIPGADSGIGEVIYAGPNVMMGYATCADDLRRGHDLDELSTGDLGRFDGAGNLEIVGRLNRFVKLHGKRVDLDHLETELDIEIAGGIHVAGDDDGVVIAVLDPGASTATLDNEMRHAVAARLDVPDGRVLVLRVGEIPTTSSRKTDRLALIEAARALDRSASCAAACRPDVTVAAAFAVVFGREPHPDATFASLGGDSFSYVEMSIRLESVLGALPVDWHLRRVIDLERLREHRPVPTRLHRWTRSVDTSVVVRAIGILLIVCTHMGIFRLAGGAHALLAVVGYNVARFQLLSHDVPCRARRSAVTVARIALPTSAWIGLNMLLAGGYSLGSMMLVNNYTGSSNRTDGRWEYWYFEAFVQTTIVLAVVFSIRSVRRAEQARPFEFAIGILALTWLFRFEVVNLGGAYNEIFRPHTIACFVALGWCAQRATTNAHRLLVSVLAAVTTLGYFETVGRVDQLDREIRILIAVLALVWIRSIRIPAALAPVVGKIAAASMWIFLVHWQVWPLFTPWLNDRVAYLITIGVGVGVWWVFGKAASGLGGWRQRRIDGRSTSSHVRSADTVISRSDATPVSA